MNRLARIREATLKLGREKQIGLAVLGGLSFILVAVIVWRLGRAGGADKSEQNLTVEQKTQPAPVNDATKPTVVQQGGHEGAAARLGGFPGHITKPPSDPINSVDPAGSARRQVIASDDRASDYSPRVAERSAPQETRRVPTRSAAAARTNRPRLSRATDRTRTRCPRAGHCAARSTMISTRRPGDRSTIEPNEPPRATSTAIGRAQPLRMRPTTRIAK